MNPSRLAALAGAVALAATLGLTGCSDDGAGTSSGSGSTGSTGSTGSGDSASQ